MIVDLIFYTLALFAFVTGYKAGLIKTVFTFIGYIAGGILGFYLAFHNLTGLERLWNTVLGSIILIIGCALIGRFIGDRLAKALRVTIIRGPLRWIDSLLGSTLELIRLVVITYIVLSLLMFSPWATLRNAVESSSVFARMEIQLPKLVTDVRQRFQEKEINELRKYEPDELKKLQLN